MGTCEVEIWVLVDENGDYAVGNSDEAANEKYNDDVNGDGARRMVKVILTVPLPVPVVLRGTVPAEPTEGAELTVA